MREKMWLEGRLEEMALLETLQLFLMSNREGRLEVSGERKGSLYFKDRMITYAICGELKGEAAVREILKSQKGKFRFDSQARPPKEECALPLQEMILEATREMDEWEKIKKLAPPLDAIPRLLVSPEGAESIELTPKEWKILSEIDGKSSVAKIAHRCKLPAFDVASALYKMSQAEILKISTPEKGITNLLKRNKVIVMASSAIVVALFIIILQKFILKSHKPEEAPVLITEAQPPEPEIMITEELPPKIEKITEPPPMERPKPVMPEPEKEEEVITPPPEIPETTKTEVPVVPFQKGEIIPAKLKSLPKPEYPAIAKQVGAEGQVIVNVLVDIDGTVREAKIIKSSGNAALDAAALEAAQNATFTPARQRDAFVGVWVAIPFTFSLER